MGGNVRASFRRLGTFSQMASNELQLKEPNTLFSNFCNFKTFEKWRFLVAFLRDFYLSGSYKDCCNMKVICLIEISSCLVKHTEVTQKYISELTELKKSKDYMQPDKTYFCISYLSQTALLTRLSLNIFRKCRDHFVWNFKTHQNT